MVDLPKMVESALLSDRQGVTTAVILSNNSRVVKKVSEVLPKKLNFVALTSSAKVKQSLEDLDFEVRLLEDSLSSQGLSVLSSLNDIILQGLGEGQFTSSDRILAILAEPMNGVILIEANSLTSNRLASMANDHDVDIEILAKLMELARYIGGRGREGHAVGALSVSYTHLTLPTRS